MDLTNKIENIELSKLSKNDLNEYLHNLKDFYLNYENLLNVNEDYTFGCEIEYRRVDKFFVDKFLKALPKWQSIIEANIVCGGEIVSPILTNNVQDWKELDTILTYLNFSKAEDFDTGAHIHIGVDILGSDMEAWKNFLYLYVTFENIIYRFYNGEYINGREKQNSVAYPIDIEMAKKLKENEINDNDDLKDILEQVDRFQGINFKNVNFDLINDCIYKNTIEIRIPNGTLKKEIWQNNINFILHLVDACKNKQLDTEFLTHEINKISEYDNYFKYYKLNIEKALYLADTIFNNNYEKAKFLVQYYKDGNVRNDSKTVLSRKKLVKN